ncbi:MAG: hypothetical protein GF308_02090 [Candidatus Heimdallarchaeota archaeon]|nr:hypothetical protein [Candidatus Heimdallarchaeota archaeon]
MEQTQTTEKQIPEKHTTEKQQSNDTSTHEDALQSNLSTLNEGNNPTEQEPASKITEKLVTNRKSVQVALLAIFTALGPALSLSFIWFPYFELMTLTIFVGGLVLGPIYGIILAIMSSTLYEIIATLAVGQALPIYPFKLLAYILIALSGAVIGKSLPEKPTFSWRCFTAIVGGTLTLCFDLIVNLGMIFFMDLQVISYFTTLLVGLPVTAIRVVSNTLLFTFVPELVSRVINPLLGKYPKDKELTQNDCTLEKNNLNQGN